MAKTQQKKPASSLNVTAETIGAALGHVAARLESWKKQRAEIAADIQKLLHSAHGMLGDLSEAVESRTDAVLHAVAPRKGGRPKGYKMSEATKRKLRAAWKRRKALKSKMTS